MTERFIAVALSMVIAQGAMAAQVANMFREKVAVNSQSQQDRQRAARQALATVLVRVSGTRDVLQSGEVQSALSSADRYLGQFTYQRNDEEDQGGYYLQMEFQPKPVTDLLRQAGQPLWSGNRPAILTCVEVSDGSRTRLVIAADADSSEQLQAWNTLIAEQAHRRGLVLRLPQSGTGGDCVAADGSAADLTLTGNLRLVGESCVAEWSMPFDGSGKEWKFGTDSREECVARGVDAVAETLSASYAFAAGDGSDEALSLQVAGIENFDDYAEVILMLQNLAMVSAVNVASVQGDTVAFSLDVQGDVDKLQQAIGMRRMLQEAEPEPVQPEPAPVLPEPAPDLSAPGFAPVPEPPPPVVVSQQLYYRLL